MINDVALAINDLVSIFTSHNIKYAIGGSISSSLNGIFRSTNDIDVVIENILDQNPTALEALSNKFIVDSETLLLNHKKNRAYNIFHQETALKIDLFPAYTDFHMTQLERAIPVKLPSATNAFNITSPEDIILAKLIWINKSPSDRQLTDIKGVINANIDSLDMEYLNKWAKELFVEEGLKKSFEKQT
jgi:hypothetical protein